MNPGAVVERRLQGMERRRDRTKAIEPNRQWYELLVRASCPPDKRVHVSGGVVSPSGRWGWILQMDFVPNWTCDFENDEETDMLLQFTNTGYYLPVILCYGGNWLNTRSPDGYEEMPILDNVIGTEVETAAEAEAQINAWLNGVEDWYYYRCPLWAVVFKNDGITGINYAIEPIDAVNRGRSYLYRDARSGGGIFP